MKKLIILVLMAVITFNVNSQTANPEKDKYGYVNHVSVGAGIGFVSNLLTYKALTSWTDMKPWQAKTISFITGVGMAYLGGHLKEDYDMRHGGFYNKNDLTYTAVGGICGSTIAGCILIIDMPDRYYKKHKKELVEF